MWYTHVTKLDAHVSCWELAMHSKGRQHILQRIPSFVLGTISAFWVRTMYAHTQREGGGRSAGMRVGGR